ncbi:MAG TPA: hypothetical protein VIH05_08260 [Tepidiformaceae bacterium]
MPVAEGPGGDVGGGWDFNDVSDILAMKTAMRTTQVGTLGGSHSGSASSRANTGLTATKVGVLNVPYDPELWAILALGGV